MPLRVYMPSACIQERFSTIPEEDENEEIVYTSEEKCGNLVMITPDNRRIQIKLMIYRTSLEHFAIAYPEANTSKPLGFINLKNTTCQPLKGTPQSGVVLRQTGFDNPSSLTFICESSREVQSWIAGLSAKSSVYSRHNSLPVLEEFEEF